ncbi:ribosomal-processing cysteine protease Prp [Sporolactobacillus spathodeae]|uniref:Ribosomal processing cysteine protease Prp n=1 Tax=Sporolactobacillus spathodeae TaxID=1465502 RepID=A0ABS2Q6M5_9BACL|nr:uncharacterized protein YsxB (DUF464 family) [Sporolactobacillus spathodeae]
MITLHVERSSRERITGFRLSGHAGSGPYGYDLVCAGVSAVSFGAINAVEALTHSHPDVKQAPDGGLLDYRADEQASESDQDKAQLILEAMIVSMRTIEQSYGKFLRIHDKGGVDHA